MRLAMMSSNNTIDNTLAVENTKPVGIRMSESFTNIVQALLNVSKELKPIEKKGTNESQKYSYARFEDFIEGVREVLFKHDLFPVTTVVDSTPLEPRPTKYGGFMYPVKIKITTRLLHKSGEWIENDCEGEGQDSGDKAIYKGITGARKYALSCLLNLSTTDDPENDEDEKKNNYKVSEPRKSPPKQYNQQSKPNGHAKPNGATTQQSKQPLPPTANPKTGEVPAPKDDGQVTFSEVLNRIKGAKTVKDLIDSYEFGKSTLWRIMTVEQKAELVRVKDEMKGKVTG